MHRGGGRATIMPGGIRVSALLPDAGFVRIFVADGIERVRQAVRDLIDLQPDMLVTGEAADDRMVATLLQQQHPDVVLLDARLVTPAPRAIRLVQRAAPGVPIVVYAANPAPGDAEAALAAGAQAFLPKDVRPHELLGALRRAAAPRRALQNFTGLTNGQGGGMERDRKQSIGSYRHDGGSHVSAA